MSPHPSKSITHSTNPMLIFSNTITPTFTLFLLFFTCREPHAHSHHSCSQLILTTLLSLHILLLIAYLLMPISILIFHNFPCISSFSLKPINLFISVHHVPFMHGHSSIPISLTHHLSHLPKPTYPAPLTLATPHTQHITTHLTIHTPCLPYPSSYPFLFLSPLYLYPLNPSFILPSSILTSVPISLTNSFTLHFLPIISLHYVPIFRISFKPILPHLCMATRSISIKPFHHLSYSSLPCMHLWPSFNVH